MIARDGIRPSPPEVDMNTGHTAVDHGRWKSWSQLTTEDRLLLAYCEEMGGLLVTEVPVGGHRKAIWPGGSKAWRIDGVRILDSSRATGEIVSFSSIGPENFEARIKDRGVEVVEVERKMNRLVVGQAISRPPSQCQTGVLESTPIT
jgi:hypothetical protein